MTVTLASPYPLGATLDADGCNFAIHCPDAKNIKLVLFNDDGSKDRYDLLEKHMGTKYAFIPGVVKGQQYGYEVQTKDGNRLLLDPYAKAISKPAYHTYPFTPEKSWAFSKSVVTDNSFDWQGVSHPNVPNSATVLFETHVKGFTKQNKKVIKENRGTYLGLCDPAIIRFFQEQGVTTIQLMPVAACMPEQHLVEMNKVNYWGYNTLCFMAPDPRYASSDAVVELKTMVRELHKAGVEVILDVVFNHTAEGGDGGSHYHFKSLDKHYYLYSEGIYNMNYSGCGNTVDVTHQPSLKIIMDSLRMWVEEYQIDGFRFDLAATLGRNGDHFNKNSPFFKSISQDPILQKVKLIAEPWDIGPDGYQVGQFPVGWHECSDKYRDTIKSFWCGDRTKIKDFATRIMGSRDLFSASNWPHKFSVNYISYHDGFTLQDLVSYNYKHNEANGEQNRDGHGDNRSYNHGVEGASKMSCIIFVREKHKRNLMATLLFSFGIPHILATDNVSHTQNGNNNAYCQDNEISWTNWDTTHEADVFQKWLGDMIQARKDWMLPFIDAFSGDTRDFHRVSWMKPDGGHMHPHDWDDPDGIVMHLGINTDGEELMLLINQSDKPVNFMLPEGGNWKVICNTFEDEISSIDVHDNYFQADHSMTILRRD